MPGKALEIVGKQAIVRGRDNLRCRRKIEIASCVSALSCWRQIDKVALAALIELNAGGAGLESNGHLHHRRWLLRRVSACNPHDC